MRVEATFQDTKSRGWDLEATLIADRARLDRLLLALFVAMCGGWVIWLLPAFIKASASPLIAMIVVTKASFDSVGSGYSISCDGHAAALRWCAVYHSSNRRMGGASLCDSKCSFRPQKKCQGESAPTGTKELPKRCHTIPNRVPIYQVKSMLHQK